MRESQERRRRGTKAWSFRPAPPSSAGFQPASCLRSASVAQTSYCALLTRRNHPFLDANKRTNFPIAILFLERNAARFTASEPSAAQAILSLAAGTLDDPALTAWPRANVQHC